MNAMSTSDLPPVIQVHVVQLVASWNSKTSGNPEQHSQGNAMATKKMQNAEVYGQYYRRHHHSTVGLHRTPMKARSLSMLKTNAVTHHSNKSAVGSP